MLKKFYISFIIFLSIFSVFFSNKIDNKNQDLVNSFVFPIKSKNFSSYYGYRDLNGKSNFHDGVDIPASPGTKIYSCNNGVIINSCFLKGYGNCIIILHDNGKKSLYGHLSENYIVSNGMYVKKGENIGYVGPKYLSLGREITDLLIAVNRTYKKSDYIPCILWGRNAKFCEHIDTGALVKVSGYTTGPHLHFTIFLQNGKTTNPLEFSYQEKE